MLALGSRFQSVTVGKARYKKLEADSHIHNQEEQKNECMCARPQLPCLLHSHSSGSFV